MKRLEIRILLGIYLLAGVVLLFWLIDRAEPVTFQPTPVVEVIAGQQARIPVAFVRHRACPVEIDSWIVDSTNGRFDYPDQRNQGRGPVGEEVFRFFLVLPIPAGMASGPATMHRVVSYFCNPIHYIYPIVNRREIKLMVDK